MAKAYLCGVGISLWVTVALAAVSYVTQDGFRIQSPRGDDGISCTTSGSVVEDGSADVTCHFPDDIMQKSSSFYVYRLSPLEPDGVILAICNWEEEALDCSYLTDCFKGETHQGHTRVTFGLGPAKLNDTGTYCCKTVPADRVGATSCSLTVQKKEVEEVKEASCHSNSPVFHGERTTIICVFSQSIADTDVVLGKYNAENATNERILTCEGDRECKVHKDGFVFEEKKDFYLRVSIPSTTLDEGGIYYFDFGRGMQAPAFFTVEVKTATKEIKRSVSLDGMMVPLYGILVCLILILLMGSFVCIQRCWKKDGKGTIQGSDVVKPCLPIYTSQALMATSNEVEPT